MKQVKLRALEPEDIDAVYRWENDPAVWQCSLAHSYFSRHALTQYILECGESDIYSAKQLRLMADDPSVPASVGCIDLFDFDPFHHRAGIGLLVDPAFRRQGYGRLIVEALEQFGRQNLQLHQLYCDIAADNASSIKVFEHCGFSRQGIRKDWMARDGGWMDAILFAKIL